MIMTMIFLISEVSYTQIQDFSSVVFNTNAHGRLKKFSRESNVDIWLIFFRLLTMQCKWTFTKRFILSTPQRKCRMLRQQSQKCVRWQQ